MADKISRTNRPKPGHDDLQVDPMLREGPAPRWWSWIVLIGAAAVLAVVIYGLFQTTRSPVAVSASETPTATGRSSAHAPQTERNGANPNGGAVPETARRAEQ